jgi:DNA-binding MarR family transcriptional regulator
VKPPSDTTTLSQLPAYLLAQTFRVVRHALDCSLREIGLTTPQWGALKCIAENEGMSGADMARIHHLTPQTMNTILHNLEHADLIVRHHHPTHGTLLQTQLTATGRERLADAMQRVMAVNDRMIANLSVTESETLAELLSRCITGLDLDSTGAPCPDE